MAQRDYGQFFDAGHAGQSDDDDWRIAAPLHPLWKRGRFTIYWIPSVSSADATGTYSIVSVGTSGAANLWTLAFVAGSGITISGVWFAPHAITFAARSELRFDLDGTSGTVTVSGALTGNGVIADLAWSHLATDTSIARIGGIVSGDASMARGWVSLPYAIHPKPLVDEFDIEITNEDGVSYIYDA